MESEKELLESIKSGDRQALRRLYSRYAGRAMAVGLRYVPQRDEANDVLQESFIKVFASIASFQYRGEGSLRGWVLRIVANEAISYLRQKSRFTFVDDMPDVPDEPGDPDVEEIPPSVLTRLIGELPEGYRVVLNLYVFGQKSHKQIAEELGIKEATSASQYLRAKRLLARKIKDYLNDRQNDEQE